MAAKVIKENAIGYICTPMNTKFRVGAVSYLNTKPLIYGLKHSRVKEDIDLILDYPARLVSLLQKNELDIALLPVAAIPKIKDAEIFSNYCIASDDEVASVCLFSEVPIEEIQEVYLDYQSETSVALCKLLLQHYWQSRPLLLEADEHFIEDIKDKRAGIIIGDRALENLNRFPYVYDLAKAWKDYTQLPFVFATWVSTKQLPESFVKEFNEANQHGLTFIDQLTDEIPFTAYDLKKYYTENIRYELNEERRNGMTLFMKQLQQ